jgi:hypothetical protein
MKLKHEPYVLTAGCGAGGVVGMRHDLTGNCDLWIVSGEGEAEFSVKVSWGKT